MSGSRFRSSPETSPMSTSPGRPSEKSAEPYVYTEGFPSEELFGGGARQDGISPSSPEICPEGESNTFNLETLLKPQEVRSKSPKIRSLRGSETKELNMESELRYSDRQAFLSSSEIRLKESALSPRHAFRDDPSLLPRFPQRVDTPIRVGDQRVDGRLWEDVPSAQCWERWGSPCRISFSRSSFSSSS